MPFTAKNFKWLQVGY